jgi:hypothetical protein
LKTKGSTIIDIYFPDDKSKDRRKGIFATRREDEILGRRKTGQFINFYDIAQIRSGETWVDHPILKTPSYTASKAGSFGSFLGVEYAIEQFLEADYQAYIDSLFTLAPVEQWKNTFRRLDYQPYFVAPSSFNAYTYPDNLYIRRPPQTGIMDTVKVFEVGDFEINDMSWETRGLKYRNFNEITLQRNASETVEWFTQSSGLGFDWGYKVTNVYDPDADDLSGTIAVSGMVDVFLIPLPTLFFAAAAQAPLSPPLPDPDAGFEVMFAYQVPPRKNYPAFVDPYGLQDQYLLNDIFLGYQKNRSGMVGSTWARSGAETISEATVSASTWSAPYSYISVCDNNDVTQVYATPGRHFRSATDNTRFICTNPLLMGVMKIQGVFYYIWSTPGDEFGNTASFETLELNGGYLLTSADYED